MGKNYIYIYNLFLDKVLSLEIPLLKSELFPSKRQSGIDLGSKGEHTLEPRILGHV